MVSVFAPITAVRISPQAIVFSLGRLLVFHVKVADTFSLFCFSFVVLLYIINSILSFINHMSCNKETFVSCGGSNCCADQLMKCDGTQNKNFKPKT